MQDLKDTTHDVHYENFRAQCISQISQHALRDRSKLKRESVTSHDSNYNETDRLLIQKDEEVSKSNFENGFFFIVGRVKFIQTNFDLGTLSILSRIDSSNARYALSNAGEIEIQYNNGDESKE